MKKGRDIHQGEPEADSVAPNTDISRRELLQRFSPLGKAELDASRCTGCGLCVSQCPTEALVISSGKEVDVFQIIFRYGSCLACGQCVEICPEKCLQVERAFEVNKLKGALVLFEDRLIRCSSCSAPLGPKSMLDRLRARIVSSGEIFPLQFKLCPDCKVSLNLAKLRM
jgi:ferredoxin